MHAAASRGRQERFANASAGEAAPQREQAWRRSAKQLRCLSAAQRNPCAGACQNTGAPATRCRTAPGRHGGVRAANPAGAVGEAQRAQAEEDLFHTQLHARRRTLHACRGGARRRGGRCARSFGLRSRHLAV